MLLKQLLFCVLSLLSLQVEATDKHKTDNGRTSKLIFIENRNQWNSEIKYSSQFGSGSLSLSENGFHFMFNDTERLTDLHTKTHEYEFYENGDYECIDEEKIDHHYYKVDFVRANTPEISSFNKTSQYYNFFIGNDSTKWASYAYGYTDVYFDELYDYIAMRVYSEGLSPKYDFIIKPDGNVKDIKLAYDGVDDIYLFNSKLYIETSLGLVVEDKPYAYQMINGKQIEVEVDYELICDTLSFKIPNGYHQEYELVIDPLLIFSTYSGSTADNWGNSATPGENGTLYSAGVTNLGFGGEFPATPGAFQTSWGGDYDASIIKFDSTGGQMLFATYLGGVAAETPHSVIMNDDGELVVFGTTSSSNFPTTTNAYDRGFNGGSNTTLTVTYSSGSDIFISKISNDGANLLASTFVGGSQNDGINETLSELSKNYGDQLRGDVITDSDNNIYIATASESSDFPIVRGFQPTNASTSKNDAIVMKLNSDLSTIMWSTYFGGIGEDAAYSIQLDMDNNVFVAGGTTSSDFTVTDGSYQSVYNGGAVDGWIAHIDLEGDSIIQSTFTGTSAYDQVYFVDLDDSEEVYVYGQTQGAIPKTTGVYSNTYGRMFVQKLSHDLSALRFSTAFGSNSNVNVSISPTAFLVSECNNLYMAGWGGETNLNSANFVGGDTFNMPVSDDAWQSSTSGSDFYLMVLTNDASEFLYGTYLGGNESRTHVDGGTSRFDRHGIVYHSVCAGCAANNATGGPSSDFPTTQGAWSTTNNSSNCNNAAFKFDLASLRARLRTNSIAFDNPGMEYVCLPNAIVFENVSIGGEVFEWDFGDGTTDSRTDTTHIVHEYTNPGAYKVTLTAIDENTCIGIDVASVTVYVFEGNFTVSDDRTICSGDEVKLEAFGGTKYYWYDREVLFSSNKQFPVVQPEDTTTYFVFIEDGVRECSYLDSVKINVIPQVRANFTVDRNYNCFDIPEITIINTSENASEYYWEFGDGTISEEQDPEHVYESGVYQMKLRVSHEFCVDEKMTEINMYPITAYNVITPTTTPGANDNFVIESPFPIQITIINRWGKIVHEAEIYKNDWNAEGEPAGVYFYDLKVNGEQECKGWVQVFK